MPTNLFRGMLIELGENEKRDSLRGEFAPGARLNKRVKWKCEN